MTVLWCEDQDVLNRLEATDTLPQGMVHEYVETASQVLYVLTGRQFTGQSTVTVALNIDRNGYIILSRWAPVISVQTVSLADGTEIPFDPGDARTFIRVSTAHRLMPVNVAMTVGHDVPSAGKSAAAAYATELVREDARYAETGATDVRPNYRLTSVSRQGVTYSYANVTDLVKEGLTGIREVDVFIRAVNPSGARYQPRVVTARERAAHERSYRIGA